MIIDDAAARQQALDVSLSFIVQAPAGSGKTELLTRRFLALLDIVNQPEEIIAISFTRKAAAEMRQRILDALKTAKEPEPEEEYKKTTWLLAKQAYQHSVQLDWNLLDNPNRLRVTTIDALCLNLVGQMPVLSRTGIQPEVSEKAGLIYLAAVKSLFQKIEQRPEPYADSINTVLAYFHYDLSHLYQLFIDMLSSREQWLPYALTNNKALLETHLVESLNHIIEDNLQQLDLALQEHPAFYDNLFLFNYASHHAHILDQGLIIDAWPDLSADQLAYWQRLSQFLLTKDGTFRKTVTKNEGFPAETAFKNPEEKKQAKDYKQQFIALLQQLSNDENLSILLHQITTLPRPDHYEQKWQIISALLDVLMLLAVELRLQFQQTGKTDFVEIANAAKYALGDETPTDLLLTLDHKIQHLLIDEFQDTSKLQYELVEKLTSGWQPNDGHTLFLVGDPMQSIYRFRQAEVGLFIKTRDEGIGELPLESLLLTTNFRSDQKIVDWINLCFQQIFPAKNDIANGAIVYSPSSIVRTYQDAKGVSYHPCLDDLDFRHQLLGQLQIALADEEQQSIAILVRSRKHAKKIMPWLRAANLPYQAVDIEQLELKPVIYDLLALTKALIHLGDKTAWFAILRAPWCGLSLPDLLLLAQNKEKTLWENLQNLSEIPGLSEDAQLRLARILPILKQALAQRFRLPLRSWIEHTWIALDGPYCLTGLSTLLDTHSYFELLKDFEKNTATWDLDALEQQIQQAFAATPTIDKKAITIMTMHKAKGLEFDTVILPALDEVGANDGKEILVWMDQPRPHQHDNDILLAICKPSGEKGDELYQYIRKQEKLKATYESSRVLYVAATRAKKNLLLYFTLEKTEKVKANSFLKLLWPVISSAAVINFEDVDIDNIKEKMHKPETINLERLPANWNSPTEKQWSALIQEDNIDADFTWKTDTERRIGLVLHRLFKILAKQELAAWSLLPLERIRLLCQLEGVNPAKINEAVKTITLCIEKIIQNEQGRWLLDQLRKPTAKVEQALANFYKNMELKQAILDATFIDEKNVRWIIDYKTAQPGKEENLESFLVTQQALYTEQLEQYAYLLAQIENRKTKLVLYFPLVEQWIEWSYGS